MKYWVEGGIYKDTSFQEVASDAERYGPYDTYEQAQVVWQRQTFTSKLDNCLHRLKIVQKADSVNPALEQLNRWLVEQIEKHREDIVDYRFYNQETREMSKQHHEARGKWAAFVEMRGMVSKMMQSGNG